MSAMHNNQISRSTPSFTQGLMMSPRAMKHQRRCRPRSSWPWLDLLIRHRRPMCRQQLMSTVTRWRRS